MKRYFPLFLIVLIFTAFPLTAEKLPPFVMPSARAAGFGGIHAAQGDDISSIFSNPAAFAGIEKQFSAAEITVSVYGPVFELLDTAVNNSGDVEDLIEAFFPNFATGFDIGGPIALGLVSNGFGIGFFNRTVMDINIDPNYNPVSFLTGNPPKIITKAWEEVLLVGGYSFRVLDRPDHILDIGLLGKAYYRAVLYLDTPADELNKLFDIKMSPLETHFGMGIDLGIKYSYNDIFTIAVAGYDVYSPALVTEYAPDSKYGSSKGQSYNTVQPRLALGLLYRLRNDFLDRYISDLVFFADYRDFISLFDEDSRHPLLDVSLGMELTVLKMLKLRAGMVDLLPSGGFGIDMTFMELDVAIRKKQLGKKPGENSVFAMDVGLLFRY